MRDIRNDLRECVQLMEARIGARNAHYEKMIKRLQGERDAAVAGLKARVAMMNKLIEFEKQDMGNTAPAATAASPKLSVATG
jgi:hypothetical protein